VTSGRSAPTWPAPEPADPPLRQDSTMGTHPDILMRRPASQSESGVSPRASTHSRLLMPPRTPPASLPCPREFVGGLAGSRIGRLMDCLILAHFPPHRLGLAVLRVHALSLTFVGFEMWRVRRRRGSGALTGPVLWTLSASMQVFWAARADIILQ
jgi:hypothetical protein